MFNLREKFTRRASYGLSRGIFAGILRVIRLKLPQFADKSVVFSVGDFRVVLVVIQTRMMFHEFVKLIHAGLEYVHLMPSVSLRGTG